jgi:hypothetical protein
VYKFTISNIKYKKIKWYKRPKTNYKIVLKNMKFN